MHNLYTKILAALYPIGISFLVLFLSACSDEFKTDTNLFVTVRGASVIPSHQASVSDRITPNTLSLVLAQVVLTTSEQMRKIPNGEEPVSLAMLTESQDDVFEILDKEKRVYYKTLDDSLSNQSYGRVEVYFKLYDSSGKSVFSCIRKDGASEALNAFDVLAVFDENNAIGYSGCNLSGKLCYKSITDFDSPIQSIGGRLDKEFTITKTKDTRVVVHVYWKNILKSDATFCEVPEISLTIEN